MKPTPERDVYDLLMAIRYVGTWHGDDLAKHVEELKRCADELAGHVQRAQRGKAA